MVPRTYVSISGHVKRPGRFLIQENMTLYDLIFKAGGFEDPLFKSNLFLDRAEQKGTGRLAAIAALELGVAAPSISEAVSARILSSKKQEPKWLLDWRMNAYKNWTKINKSEGEPDWAMIDYPGIDYQDIYYYAAPKSITDSPKSLDEVDPEMLATFEKLGIPLNEREKLAGVAVDAVFDSVSVATTM